MCCFPNAFAVQNNYHTRHLAKILIHMVLSLQESLSTRSGSSIHSKAISATYISSVFLKYIIENGKSGTFEELYLSLPEIDMDKDALLMGNSFLFILLFVPFFFQCCFMKKKKTVIR